MNGDGVGKAFGGQFITRVTRCTAVLPVKGAAVTFSMLSPMKVRKIWASKETALFFMSYHTHSDTHCIKAAIDCH